jgi:hypothetical protein
MLRLLGISGRWSDMSFSVRCARTALEYHGSSLNGLFAQGRNIFRPSFYRMLIDILMATAIGATGEMMGRWCSGYAARPGHRDMFSPIQRGRRSGACRTSEYRWAFCAACRPRSLQSPGIRVR